MFAGRSDAARRADPCMKKSQGFETITKTERSHSRSVVPGTQGNRPAAPHRQRQGLRSLGYTEIDKEETSGSTVRLEQLMERGSTFEGEEHRGTVRSAAEAAAMSASAPPYLLRFAWACAWTTSTWRWEYSDAARAGVIRLRAHRIRFLRSRGPLRCSSRSRRRAVLRACDDVCVGVSRVARPSDSTPVRLTAPGCPIAKTPCCNDCRCTVALAYGFGHV